MPGMTVCPKGHMYQDTKLECPMCVANSGDDALQEIQPEFVAKAATGLYSLRLVKVAGGRHALMYSSYTRLFCGPTLPERPRISYETWTAEVMEHLCPGCRSALLRIAAQGAAAQ